MWNALVSIVIGVFSNHFYDILKEKALAPFLLISFFFSIMLAYYEEPLSVPLIIIVTLTGFLFFLMLFPMGFKRKVWKGDFVYNDDKIKRVCCIYNFDASSNKKIVLIDFFLLSSLSKRIDFFTTKGELVWCDDGAFFAYQIDDQYREKNFFESNCGVFIGKIQQGRRDMDTRVSYLAMENNKKIFQSKEGGLVLISWCSKTLFLLKHKIYRMLEFVVGLFSIDKKEGILKKHHKAIESFFDGNRRCCCIRRHPSD